jgi:WD40 repeat protein
LHDNVTAITSSVAMVGSIWNTVTGELIKRVGLLGLWTGCLYVSLRALGTFGLAVHPEEAWFASSRWDGDISFWSPDFSQRRCVPCGKSFASLALSSQYLVVGLSDGPVSVYDIETGTLVRELAHHEGMVFALALSESDSIGMSAVCHVSTQLCKERMRQLKFSD